MADKDAKTRGKEVVEQYLSTLSEEQRTILTPAVMNDQTFEFWGAAALRQDEFSRLAAKAQEDQRKAQSWHENLTKWHGEKTQELANGAAAAAELAKLKETGGTGDDPPSSSIKTPAVDLTQINKDVDTKLAGVVTEGAQLIALTTKLTVQHLREFDEVLDVDELFKFSREKQLPLDRGGYEAYVRDKRAANDKKKREEEIAAAEKRGEEKARAAMATTPYPVENAGMPGTLSNMPARSKDAKPVSSGAAVDAAVQRFNKGMRQHYGGGGS